MASVPYQHADVNEFYTLGKELGKGAFSVVRLGVSKKTGEQVAVKIMPIPEDKRKLEMITTEIEILRRVNSANVVKLYDIFEYERQIYLVIQLIQGGELFEKIAQQNFYSESDAAHVMQQIFTGIKALHAADVVHRDLKPENLLLVENSTLSGVIITDFGLSAILKPEEKFLVYDPVGTPTYLAPEVLITLDTNEGYSKEVDLWAAGVILYILLCGFPPFYGDDEEEVYEKIETLDYCFPPPYWDGISQGATDLISKLLVSNPQERLTVDQALEHPWIVNYDLHSKAHMVTAVEKLAQFNASRKFKGAIKGLIAIQKLQGKLNLVRRRKVNQSS